MHSISGPDLSLVYRHEDCLESVLSWRVLVLAVCVSPSQDESLPLSPAHGLAGKSPQEAVLSGARSVSVAVTSGIWLLALLEATSALVGGTQARGTGTAPTLAMMTLCACAIGPTLR